LPKRLRRIVLAVWLTLGAFYISIAVLILLATIGTGAHNRATGRCTSAQPADAWAFTIEWSSSERAFICAYQGRDYRPRGDELRVGLRDLL
jgi:hypothetical protein